MMRPVFNPQSNQVQTNGAPASAPQPQVLESNKKFQTNPINLLPQIQSQMGLINPQTPGPFSNPNTQLGNMSPSFLNVPNQFFQNGMFPLGQFPNGFGPQNLNMGMNQFNMSQLNGQILTPNVMNQGVSLPNGQFFMQNPLQNMGQFVQVPMLNVPFIQNQASQIRGPQNPSFNGNQQFGVMNYNGVSIQSNQQQNPSNSSQPLQGNSSLQPVFGSVQPQQTQNFQPHVFNNQQGNPRNDNLINNMANNGRNSQSKNFERHPRQDKSHGFTKSQTHHMQNAKGKFKNSNGRGAKAGFQNEWSRKSILPDPSNGTPVEKKRLLPLNYTEQEIQQWREARKRHYPSKTNIEKKSKKKMAEAEVADMEAKLRRQQLKEVLVKQAELGCEVAEIPSHYLSDSEKPINGAEQNRPAFNKKGRSRNRSNKRGRHENDRYNKKQRPSNNNPANTNDQNVSKEMQRTKTNDTSLVKKEPTLLQKLLSADIRRDRNRLLQVFRFMVMNSFFKDHPEKPIMFPTVIVRENQGEGELAEGKTSHADEDHIDAQVDEVEDFCEEENTIDKAFVGAPEEEGEIMD